MLQTRLVILCGFVELTILLAIAGRQELWLIDSLGISNMFCSGLIMAFVDEHRTIFFDTILVRSVRMERHQNHGMPTSQPKIHTALQTRTFPLAHLEVRNDIASHGTFFSALNVKAVGRDVRNVPRERLVRH
jgi:hypothetical protein